MPSRAIACSRRGAPVKLCKPAPQQEKNEPITITHGEGHDNVPITRFPFTESPNLQSKRNHVLKRSIIQTYSYNVHYPNIFKSLIVNRRHFIKYVLGFVNHCEHRGCSLYHFCPHIELFRPFKNKTITHS